MSRCLWGAWEGVEGLAQKQNGAHTPCGVSTSFSSRLPGDGRLEVLDPVSGSPFRPARSVRNSALAGLRTCHSDVGEL